MNKAERRRMGEPRFICPFPGCPRTFWKKEGKPNLCNHHRQFVDDLVFALNNLKPPQEVQDEKEAGPKLFVPKPGMENQAIEEAKLAQGKRP